MSINNSVINWHRISACVLYEATSLQRHDRGLSNGTAWLQRGNIKMDIHENYQKLMVDLQCQVELLMLMDQSMDTIFENAAGVRQVGP